MCSHVGRMPLTSVAGVAAAACIKWPESRLSAVCLQDSVEIAAPPLSRTPTPGDDYEMFRTPPLMFERTIRIRDEAGCRRRRGDDENAEFTSF